MMMADYTSARRFQLWDFHVSHCQLLLRSVREEHGADSTNVDMIFKDVFYLDIATDLTGLEITSPTAEEAARLAARTGVRHGTTPDTARYFVLASQGSRFYIGAVGFLIDENALQLMETSLDRAYQVPT